METREEWLERAVVELRQYAKQQGGFGVPEVHVTVGWPTKGGLRDVMGEYVPISWTKDKRGQIFINPRVDEAGVVLSILLHELIHASDDGASKHKGDFARRHKDLGFVGKATTHATGDELSDQLKIIASELGPYPHPALSAPAAKERVQKTYMLKFACAESGYTVRTTQKWVDEIGAPICPCHQAEMIKEEKPESA